jgi:predicted dehydrogenase
MFNHDESSGSAAPNKSRREFVKNTTIAAAGFFIVPRHVLGGKGYVAPSDRLLIAGIGAGGKAGDDVNQFAKSPNAEIAFLCDVDDRQAADLRKKYPKAKYYKDWRELYDKESKNFDAVSVGTPDHNHAVIAFHAMQLGKHVYVQKPLTHDIYEARVLTEAAEKYKVVNQMGDQGSSHDDLRLMKEWYDAGLVGEVHTVYCWTDRPVWPQGIPWPKQKSNIPAGLDWDLWLGTAQKHEYIENLVPFNWRGWWDFGTGALGDMGTHLIGPVFKILDLGYPTSVHATASTIYTGIFEEAYYPESGPVSSSLYFNYKLKSGKPLKLVWMDGGIQPERPVELKPNEKMGGGGNGALLIGTKGKMTCDIYGSNPELLPTNLTKETKVEKKYPRVPGSYLGHYVQWVDACRAGYENAKVSSPFKGYAGPLTESVLMGNLALLSFNFREKRNNGGYNYPGRGISLEWDAENMRVTNFEQANQFIRRKYREGWPELKL